MLKSFLFCLVFCAAAWAQATMEVVKKSGPSDLIPLSTITKITFTATDMVVGGPNKNIPISEISVILFNDKGGTAVEEGGESLFSFETITPNPFNPATGIRFGLFRESPVRIVVFSTAGNRVKEILDKPLKAGYYQVAWDGKDDRDRQAAAGTYIVKLTLGSKTVSKKAVLVK